MADAIVAVEDRHRQEDRPELPGGEEDRRGLRGRRQHDCDAVAACDAVIGEPVRGLVGEILEIAPAELARRPVVALPDHRRLVARVLFADVPDDVVALGAPRLVLAAQLVLCARGALCHGLLLWHAFGARWVYQTGVFDANGSSSCASC